MVNITGGKDLKLFEVDEVVNKIRSEVEADAEVIIGAITDSSLEGKIRVSIVATALDGQQPETKSVINMVHRIQNRNPGYSDFSNLGSNTSFNFSTGTPISSGANALKLENEISTENVSETVSSENINQINDQYHEELLKNQQVESLVENTKEDEESSFTQEAVDESPQEDEIKDNLKEFGVDRDAPDLFSSQEETSSTENLLSQDNEDQEDDLEIPAFLRRQKN